MDVVDELLKNDGTVIFIKAHRIQFIKDGRSHFTKLESTSLDDVLMKTSK